jgi:hypothetical protein
MPEWPFRKPLPHNDLRIGVGGRRRGAIARLDEMRHNAQEMRKMACFLGFVSRRNCANSVQMRTK